MKFIILSYNDGEKCAKNDSNYSHIISILETLNIEELVGSKRAIRT